VDVQRARRIKIGLAALAVLGVGAALTSAAWTDVVFFDADVTTGNFNLEGALPADQAAPVAPTDDAAWLESDDETAIELSFDEIQFAANETVTVTGYVRNDPASTWTADLTSIAVDETGLPGGVTAAVAFTAPSATPTDLAPGAVATFELTVTADGTVVEGAVGSLVVEANGESVDPVAVP
jgi:predicted ribosomally synthesized peptide with SipW-like signal peptide